MQPVVPAGTLKDWKPVSAPVALGARMARPAAMEAAAAAFRSIGLARMVFLRMMGSPLELVSACSDNRSIRENPCQGAASC